MLKRLHGFRPLVVLSLFASSCVGSGASVDSTAMRDGVESAEHLVEAHVEALGGYDAFSKINTLTYIGTYEEGGNREVHRFDRRRPNLIRVTTSYDEETGSYGYSEGFDGAAWEYSSRIPVRVIGEPANALKNASRFEPPYIDYERKGHQIDLLGTVNIKGHELYHLRVTQRNGSVGNYFFDVSTLMQDVSLGNAPFHGDGASIEIFEERSDYRPVGGVLVPHQISQKSGDEVLASLTWHTIEANRPVPDGWFSPPLSVEQESFQSFRQDILDGVQPQAALDYKAHLELVRERLDKKLENELNTLGYELHSYERYEDAIEVFNIATLHFPRAGNIYDSLGETYLLIGDTIEAIRNYERSVELNPDNTRGAAILSEIR